MSSFLLYSYSHFRTAILAHLALDAVLRLGDKHFFILEGENFFGTECHADAAALAPLEIDIELCHFKKPPLNEFCGFYVKN